METYRRGQDVEFETVISANHHGRFQFRICKYKGSEREALTEECLDEHVLRMSRGEQDEGGVYWYTGPNDAPQTYTMRYRLPDGLVCDGVGAKCVLQWYWASQNSCILQDPDPPAAYLPTSNMSKCGTGNTRGEAFWNCASIRITEDGGGGTGSGEQAPTPSEDVVEQPTPPTPQDVEDVAEEAPVDPPPTSKKPSMKASKKPGKKNGKGKGKDK